MISLLIFLSSPTIDLKVEGEVCEPYDISALTCMDSNHCLIASDETNLLQRARLVGHRLHVDPDPILLGGFDRENDIEGLTNDGTYFYAIGSHGLSRKKGQYHRSRFKLFRILLDESFQLIELKSTSLENILRDNPTLSPFLRKPLHENGIDIEGLGYFEGRLYFGFRGPIIDGRAPMMAIALDSLFKEKSLNSTELSLLKLGEQRGIRSLEFRGSHLFIVSGQSPASGNLPARFHQFNLFPLSQINIASPPYSLLKVEGFDFLHGKNVLFVHDSVKGGLPTLQSLKSLSQ